MFNKVLTYLLTSVLEKVVIAIHCNLGPPDVASVILGFYYTRLIMHYTVSGKKGATLFLPVTLRIANRFSKFFRHHTLQ